MICQKICSVYLAPGHCSTMVCIARCLSCFALIHTVVMGKLASNILIVGHGWSYTRHICMLYNWSKQGTCGKVNAAMQKSGRKIIQSKAGLLSAVEPFWILENTHFQTVIGKGYVLACLCKCKDGEIVRERYCMMWLIPNHLCNRLLDTCIWIIQPTQ